jgi:hypothetical protein
MGSTLICTVFTWKNPSEVVVDSVSHPSRVPVSFTGGRFPLGYSDSSPAQQSHKLFSKGKAFFPFILYLFVHFVASRVLSFGCVS